MIAKIKALFFKYRETIVYLIFGVLTTLVNFAVYYPMLWLGIDYRIDVVVAWFVSVAFAYITNRRYVFESKVTGAKNIALEALSFFGGRGFSGLMDYGLMILSVDILLLDEGIMKLVVNVIVIIVNYIISKLLIFRKDKR